VDCSRGKECNEAESLTHIYKALYKTRIYIYAFFHGQENVDDVDGGP
jgi:hypothetical protein